MVRSRNRFARPATDEDFRAPLQVLDAAGWLGDIHGRRLLCLAAGGGRQGPLYAAAGAVVTVVDISSAQLALDREVAAERGLQLTTLQASMDRLEGLADQTFDVVVHPVSTCYVPQVGPVFAEVYRVIRPGGVYVSQHKQPASLQLDPLPGPDGYVLRTSYYHPGPLPAVAGSLHREEGTLEFLHRWEDLLGGICRAGFVIEDVQEPQHAAADAAPGTFAKRSQYAPPYIRLKARRPRPSSGTNGDRLWLP